MSYPPVISYTAEPDNYGVANLGQAKWMVKSALESLRLVLPDVADDVESDLAAVTSLAVPTTPEEKAALRAPLLIGQLKALSAPFYQRIGAVAPDWLAEQCERNELILSPQGLPWTTALTDDANRATAVVGQLKAMFSLDFHADYEVETAKDGISDLWEHVVVNSDPNDGFTGIGDINAENGEDAGQGTGNGTPPAPETDRDNDGVPDAQDADPTDKAICWMKTPETSYLVKEIASPGEGFEIIDLGEGGQVLAGNGNWSFYEWVVAPTLESVKSKVWIPSTNAWTELPQSAGCLGRGVQIDPEGGVVGNALQALKEIGGNNPSTFPGSAIVPGRWKASLDENGEVTYSAFEHDWTDYLWPFHTSFDPEYGGTVINPSAISELAVHYPKAGKPGNHLTCKLDRQHTNGASSELKIYLASNASSPIWYDLEDSGNDFVKHLDSTDQTLGSGSGWFAITYYSWGVSGMEMHAISPDGVRSDGPPVDTGEGTQVVRGIAEIDRSLLPEGADPVVVWTTHSFTSQEQCHVGKVGPTGEITDWAPSTKSGLAKLAGKVNARGEGLRGSEIWRNGKWHALSKHVDATKWANLSGMDITDSGMLLVKADVVGTGGQGQPAQKAHLLFLPIEIGSMDRFMAGAIDDRVKQALGGDRFGMSVKTPAEANFVDWFSNLSEIHVYENPYSDDPEAEDKFLSNEEVAMGENYPDPQESEPGSNNGLGDRVMQPFVFYHQYGKLHFRLLFDVYGEHVIRLRTTETGDPVDIKWTISPDEHIASLINLTDQILAGNHPYQGADGGGVIPAAMQAGLSEEEMGMLNQELSNMQAQAAQSQSGVSGFFKRHLTIKVTMPSWEAMKYCFQEGMREVGKEYEQLGVGLTMGAKGFLEGAWMGIKDDTIGALEELDELRKMVLNPVETAKMFRDGLDALMKLDWEGWKNVGRTMVRSFLDKGREGVDGWAEPSNYNVAFYLVGFTAGFIAEQIAVTYITGGILKVGGIGAKVGKFVRNAAKGIVDNIDNIAGNAAHALRKQVMKTKNSMFRAFSQGVGSADEVKSFKTVVEKLQLECPLPVH